MFLLLPHSRSCWEEQRHTVYACASMRRERSKEKRSWNERKIGDPFLFGSTPPSEKRQEKEDEEQQHYGVTDQDLSLEHGFHTLLISPKMPVKYFFGGGSSFYEIKWKEQKRTATILNFSDSTAPVQETLGFLAAISKRSGWLHTGLTSLHQWEGCYVIGPFTHHSYVMQGYSPFFDRLEISGFK